MHSSSHLLYSMERWCSNKSDYFSGVPAISVPSKLSTDGLPIGLQFIGQNFKDKELLTIAKWYEQQVQFKQLNLDYLDNVSWWIKYIKDNFVNIFYFTLLYC